MRTGERPDRSEQRRQRGEVTVKPEIVRLEKAPCAVRQRFASVPRKRRQMKDQLAGAVEPEKNRRQTEQGCRAEKQRGPGKKELNIATPQKRFASL